MRRGRLWSVLVACVMSVVAVVSGAAPSAGAVVPPLQGCGYAEWMGCQLDSRYISLLSIPGAHDTGALWADGFPCNQGPEFTIAQTENTFDQLNTGIRFLDIRFGSESWAAGQQRLRVYHGPCAQRIYADTSGPIPNGWYALLTDVLHFLVLHPSETVIMSVKDEDTHHRVAFEQLMSDLIARTGRSRWWLNDSIPRLGQARGKIVLVRRFTHEVLNIGGMNASSGWPNNTTGSFRNFVVEDDYQGATLTPARKRDVVGSALTTAHRAIASARQRGVAAPMHLTFTSANGFNTPGGCPRLRNPNRQCTIGDYATVLDPYLAQHFPSAGPSGIVMMDEATPDIAHRIVDSNR